MKWILLVPVLFFCYASNAQLCTGGLGDPIVQFTFGSGSSTYGGPLAAGITNMTYVTDSCPQGGDVGSYAIVHSPGTNCFGGDWLTFTGDHTGDPNGYFMLINASTPPSDFYVQPVSGLCPSTTYQFGAWIVNMASHSGEIAPNITFSIEEMDGTLITSYQTGDVPWASQVQWNQYAFDFTTPPGVSAVVLRMTNNAPGGYGNDLGLDDITFRTSGPAVSINIAGHIGDTVNLCANPGNILQFTGTVASCYASTACQWQESTDGGSSWNNIPGASSLAYSALPVATGNYLYRLTAAEAGNIGISACQVTSTADSIIVLATNTPAVTIALVPDHVCVDSSATFMATITDGGSQPLYQWMVNGSAVGTNAPTYTNSALSDGDLVDCVMISNALCAVPPSATSNTVTIQHIPDVNSSVDIVASASIICQDSLVVFTASPSNGGSTPSYEWTVNGLMVGSNAPVYRSGDLRNGDVVGVVMTSGLRCSSPVASNTVAMTVYDVPQVQLPSDTVIAPGGSAILNPVITGAFEAYNWTPTTGLNDPALLHPTATPDTTTTYQIDISNGNGCTASAKEIIEVFYDLLMPNAFTPNGDGHNDQFIIPPSIDLAIQQFSIYDRWGKRVFRTTDSKSGWDGTVAGRPQPPGTYVWVIWYDNPILKRVVMKRGTVVLIR